MYVMCTYIRTVKIIFLTKEQALEEIDWYIKTIEKEHPDPYHYTNKESVDSVLNALRIECNAKDSIISQDFIMDLSAINYFWDGHTYVFPNGSLYNENSCFPLIHADDKENIYLSTTNTLIESINGYEIEEIVTLLDKYRGADSFNANNYILLTWSDMFNAILNEANILPPYTIRGRTPNGVDTTFVQNAWNKDKLKKQKNKKKQFSSLLDRELYELQIFPSDSIALITYDACLPPLDYVNIDSIMNSFFSNCKDLNIKYLFIDISRNNGGFIGSSQIFTPYLMKENLRYDMYSISNAINDTARLSFSFLHGNYHDYSVKPFKNNKLKPFEGDIFVYQSPWTGSAAGFLASILKATANSIVVGTKSEPMIPYTAFNMSYQFPYSNATLKVSSRRVEYEKPQLPRDKNGSLLIDIEYPFNINERIKLKDIKLIISKYKDSITN